MAGFFKQVVLLMWKNAKLYVRRPCTLVFEIGVPIFFALILVCIRLLIDRNTVDTDTYYNPFTLHPANISSPNMEIGFVPNYANVDTVMGTVITKLNSYTGGAATKVGFATESQLLTYYSANSDKLRLAVVFYDVTSGSPLPTNMHYRIRPATGKSEDWDTGRTYQFSQNNAPRSAGPDYIYSGVAYLQAIVGEAILTAWGSAANYEMFANRMPYPPYYEDSMILVIQGQLPLFIMLSFILTVVQTTKTIVMEKERRIKESMKLMGLTPAAHWTSWFLTTFIYLVVTLLIYTVLFSITIKSSSGSVLAETDASLFYVFLLCYAVALITFCFMISSIAKKANIGAAQAGVLFFGFFFPYLFLQRQYETLDPSTKLGLCCLFNMAMSFGANIIALHEGTGAGAQWDNFSEPAIVDDNLTLLQCMLMLLLDTFIHLIITWYIDNVWPGEFGVPKPFYFPFTKSYWCSGKPNSDAVYDSSQTDEEHFEREPSDLTAGIQICNLTKNFAKGKVAVDNLRLKMYEEQITVLLGHNGAGKTTTMSMLTGFIAPSSGTALVNNYDINKDIVGVRKSLGLCPQHNILWDTLTVEEHLWFFAQLKGCESSKVQSEVNDMVKEVGLEAKKRTQSGKLSGGQKRKLSVGIALIGGSKVVVLDEPSSGMDPAARRQTWELLQRNRAGRTMLLTTHYMDEADVLGDRIAIMSEGVVKCCGSSLFLKKLFGTGYHLVVVKDGRSNVSVLTDAVKSKIPSAELEGEVNQEVSYLLPDNQSASFPGLFRFLDERKSELGIVGFGTSATTMEEVFLKVGENADDDIAMIGTKNRPGSAGVRPATRDGFTGQVTKENDSEKLVQNGKEGQTSDNADNIMAFNRNYTKLSGWRLQWSHFYGMFIKKILLSWRHRLISVVQLLMPVTATALSLLIDTDIGKSDEPMLYNLDPFGTTYVSYSNGSTPIAVTETAATAYANTLTHHYLQRVDLTTSNNMSQYLTGLASSLTTSRYNSKAIIGAVFDTPASGGTLKATAFYNGQPYHALPVAISFMLNGLAKIVGSSYSLTTSMHPLPKDADAEADDSSLNSSTQGFLVGFSISFGMAFLTSSFVYFLVKEREVGAKHLQVVSGVGAAMYWLATFVWDYLNYMITVLAMLIVFAAYGTEAYVQDNRLGLVLLILMMYGWAALAFVYLVSFLFKSPATAMVVLIMFNIITGLVTSITVYVLSIPGLGLESESGILEWIFLVLFPNYCMAKSIMDIYTNYLNTDSCNKQNYRVTCLTTAGPCCKYVGTCTSTCLDFEEDYATWESPGTGRFLTFMFIQGLVLMSMVLVLELGLFDKLKALFKGGKRSSKTADVGSVPLAFINGSPVSAEAKSEDSDVALERKRVNIQKTDDLSSCDPLLLMNLTKRYGSFTATDSVCVGVPEMECFGLLGQNGAGKTTTFKMLTGDVNVTSGSAYLKGYNVITEIKKVQQNMGYCPQFDALLDTMTGRETLRMYARLRGVPTDHIEDVIDHLIEIMMLEPHKDKQAGFYSGGNKRKLSTAIALVGDPPFLLLDEPSAGVDPAARRQLWTVLSQVRASGRTLVLTSHSMEECDALCTRIAIMVNGQFKCLGSPQHLKNKFGHGYTLIVKMGLSEDGLVASQLPVIEKVTQSFSGASVFDNLKGYVHFQVPDDSAHVADVFSVMEQAKAELNVEDYSVHQTTLEQVFLTFTRKQVVPKEESSGSCLNACFCCDSKKTKVDPMED